MNGRLEGGASHGLLVRDRARGGAWTGRGRLAGGRDDTAATRWLGWYEVVVPAATAGGLAEFGTNGP